MLYSTLETALHNQPITFSPDPNRERLSNMDAMITEIG